MRKVLGSGVLVLGTVALGLWARADHAARMEAAVEQATAIALAASVHGVGASVSGRDITLTGLADTAAERAALLAAAQAVPGRRIVNADGLAVLPAAVPYVTEITKAEGGALSASGHLPREALRASLGERMGGAQNALTLASGAPDSWAELVQAGAGALAPFDFGTARIEDDRLTLSGQMLGPDQHIAMLGALGPFADSADITNVLLLDDGSPPRWQFDFSANSGAVLTGKLPLGITPDLVQRETGLRALSGEDVSLARIGDAGDAGLWARLGPVLALLETLRLTGGPEGLAALAGFARGVDLAAAQAALARDLGAGIDQSVETATPGADEGAERVHAATGLRERLSGGYWLEVPSFTPSLSVCTEQTNAVLAGETINFLSGSAQLDAGALAILNRLGSVIRECATVGGLKAEIGGHTDASGTPEANRRLSQLRASAVRLALIERGAPREALVSRGYGDTQPIADNATDDGKAQNRRTTSLWTQ